jgi:hypothetical protein
MHLRQEIKSKIVLLLTNKTNAEDRVYPNRFMPLDEENLPAVCVYAITENVSEFDNLTDKRILEIAIECLADGENADNDLDVLANQIETVFIENETLDKLVHKTDILRTEIGYDEKSQSQMQAAKLTYQVIYFTDKTNEASEDFNKASVDWKDFENTEDEINMPQHEE